MAVAEIRPSPTSRVRRRGGPGRADRARSGADRRRRHPVRLLPVPLGHGPDHGQGRAAKHWESHRREGLPARLRLDREPLHRPARQLHRLRPRGGRARRRCPSPRRSRCCPGTDASRASGARASGTARSARIPAASSPPIAAATSSASRPQFEAEHGAPPARRHRARDDVAEAEGGRHARRPGRDEAVLLPHRPVLRAPAGHPQGDRVRAGARARHDPGRPRGRARADRAELRLRPRREHRRQPVDVPPDLQAGRPRARRLPVLHAEAVHGRLGQRLPPQHLALARRRERLHARDRRPAEAEPARPLGDRRDHRAPRRADRDHRLDRQLVPPALGHGLLGTGLRRLGLPEPDDRAARLGAGSLRVPDASTRPSTRTSRSQR